MMREAVANRGMEGGDWRTQLQPDSRQRIVNTIMDTLKWHLPFSGQEGLLELNNIAVRFEEKMYTVATSQQDYLRKITLKMRTLETKTRNPIANSLQSNATSNIRNPQDQESESMQSQIHQQGSVRLQSSMQSQIHQQGSVQLQSSEHVQFPIQQHQQQQAAIQQYVSQQQHYLLQLLQLQQAQMYSVMQLQQNSIAPNQVQQQQQQQTRENNISNLQQLNLSDYWIAQLQPLMQSDASQDPDESGGDWQEQVYQKIKSMNEMYFPPLNELYWRMSAKLQEQDVVPQQLKNEQLEKLRSVKDMLKRFILFVRTNKNEVQILHKDSIVEVEKQVVNLLNTSLGSSFEQ